MIAEVIVDILNSEVDKVFEYSILEGQDIVIGSRVLVPFGRRSIEGYVIAIKETSTYDRTKIKPIIKPLDDYIMIKPEFIEIMNYMTSEYNTRKADCLRLFVPPMVRNNIVKVKTVDFCSLNMDIDIIIKANAKNQLGIVEELKDNKVLSRTILNNKFSSAAVNNLIKKDIILVETKQVNRAPESMKSIEAIEYNLTSEQENAKNEILKSKNTTILLHGVTGSGKTEVYLRCIKEALKEGKSAIMLVPEIGLTPQMFRIFRSNFGDSVAILHSGLGAGERYDEWQKLRTGEAKVAIGARSCIFAPLDNLGLIIIDEEHDSSYISHTNPRYDTLEVAKFRAIYNNCNLILGTATPSIESYNKALNGEYKLISMPNRVTFKPLPELEIVNMSDELLAGNNSMFSRKLIKELTECLDNNNQAMIFLNRRGFASFVMCKECGYVAKCQDCDATLVYHKEDHTLKCHYCGKSYYMLNECPECHSKYLKQGLVGTQRVADELHKIFKDVKILRMDNDTTKTKNSHLKILEEFASSKPAILVGTQMIAKGHDFADVTFIGILDADMGLHSPDYRSSERTFQLITQVSGRAGRSDKPGKVVLQTYTPRHYIYNLAKTYNYKAFFERELNVRETTMFPPFSTIIRVLSSSENEESSREQIKNIYHQILNLKDEYKGQMIFCEAMKSPIKRLQRKYRYQVLLRFFNKNAEEIKKKIYNIVNENLKKDTSCFVEINPQNLS